MSKKYTLTLLKDYCEDWTVVDALREVTQNNLDSPETFEYEIGDDLYSEDTLQEFKVGLHHLKLASVYLGCIDYLVSGDDGEDSFHRRLLEDLRNLN